MHQITTKKDNVKDYILYASEEMSLLRIAEKELINDNILSDIVRYEQGEFDLSELISELGIMSFFDEKRLIVLRVDEIGKFDDEDLELMCSTIEVSEACRIAIFINLADKYTLDSKKAKMLIGLFKELGVFKNIAALNDERLKTQLLSAVKSYNCTIDNAAIDLMVNKFSGDILLLFEELAKVAALCNYSNITVNDVEKISTTVLSADIFSLISMLTSGNHKECFKRLKILINQGQEPIAILAAITGTFIDIYRVKVGQGAGKKYNSVFKEFGYKGSEYRLKKATEISTKINRKKLSRIMKLLIEADQKLKSTAVDREIVLHRYLFDIGRLMARR